MAWPGDAHCAVRRVSHVNLTRFGFRFGLLQGLEIFDSGFDAWVCSA